MNAIIGFFLPTAAALPPLSSPLSNKNMVERTGGKHLPKLIDKYFSQLEAVGRSLN